MERGDQPLHSLLQLATAMFVRNAARIEPRFESVYPCEQRVVNGARLSGTKRVAKLAERMGLGV
jgi:hypothetical protein